MNEEKKLWEAYEKSKDIKLKFALKMYLDKLKKDMREIKKLLKIVEEFKRK